jgi:hypothetical protein
MGTGDSPISEYAFSRGEQRGSRFTLFSGRLVHEGGNVIEHMPLAHLAALRIEFLREPGKLKWAIIFLVLALVLNGVSTPLQGLAASAGEEVAAHAKREGVSGGVSGALGLSFRVLERVAGALPGIGLALAALAAASGFLFWRGRTLLTLAVGAAEREYSVPGRDQALMAFAEALGGRLAELSG